MTLEDWVTLSVIWWSGDKRRAIADWLSEHAHRRTCVTSEMTLQGLLADIDRVQPAKLDIPAARVLSSRSELPGPGAFLWCLGRRRITRRPCP